MSIKDLLTEVEEQKDKGSLAIDLDSILFFSAYAFRENWNVELAYADVMERIGSIKQASYTHLSHIEEVALCLTSKTNFRYELYPEYKANRKTDDEKAIELSNRVKELKRMIMVRLKPLVRVSSVWEADDIVVQLADKGWIVSAMDKDIVNACPTPCYQYKKREWYESKTKDEISEWYLIQSVAGDSGDGIKGVKGKGMVGATKFVKELLDGKKSFDEYVDLFDTPAECLLMNRLVRMNQYEGNKLKLITIKEIADSIPSDF